MTARVFGVATAVSLVLAIAAGAQAPAGPSREILLAAAKEIMVAVRYCAVVTVDASGRPQARTVDAFAPDDRLVVWFATNPKTRKAAELAKDGRVTLHYFDASKPGQGYVTLFGRARLVNDPAEKQRRWKPEWERLWPDRDASYLLVEVTPERIEVVSPARKINGDPVTWLPASVEFGRDTRDR